MSGLEGGESALRFDDGLFYSSLEDDYCLPVPSHAPELERLDICHEIYKRTIGHTLPKEVVDHLNAEQLDRRILDLGSGTGKWVQEIALEFPHVEVCGIDLVDPPLINPPPNTSFTVSNFLCGFQDEDESYDLVHIRDIALGVRDYAAILTDCVRVLKPGGYLVVQEMEWLVDFLGDMDAEVACPNMYRFMRVLHTAMKERELDPLLGYNLEHYVSRSSNLSLVHSNRYCVPIAPRGQDETEDYLGRLSLETWGIFAQSARLLFEDHGAFDSQDMSQGGRNEFEGKALYWFFDVCLARKE